uniref:C-type lectin domain-containing protein n=1 Tax=Oreochromis niloticus TaxID=8128 RepID=A0A669C0X1_ORENI
MITMYLHFGYIARLSSSSPQSSMMIVKILLGVLYLSGGLVLSKCRRYHFVNKPFTWYEAQSYCRKNYVGLACIENSEEMNQVINTVSSAGYNSEVWIGVYIHLQRHAASQNDDESWNWKKQIQSEPFLVSYFCQSISVSGQWYSNCSVEHPFICYNGTSQSPQYVLVNESMDWFRALRYCRENFTDIASYSISDSQLQILLPNGDRAWIGVISYPEIRQRDCGNSSFRYWDDFGNIPSIFRSLFGVADLQRSGKWRLIEYFTKIPFVCFDNLPAPGKENVQKKAAGQTGGKRSEWSQSEVEKAA